MSEKVIRVLSIEDSTAVALLIEELLKEATRLGWDLPSFEVEHVSSTNAGLERLDGGGIDVVLSDLDLPDSRAGDTFAKIHAHAPDMPIVVLTGRDDEELARRTVRIGAEDYLFKREMSGSLLAHSLIYAIERQQAKHALRKAHGELERRVDERTRELREANEKLEAEIAERERVESALRESESKYRGLVERSLQGMVIAQDNPLRISFASKPMEAITGFSPDELEKLGPQYLMELIHPQDRDMFFQSFRARLHGKDVAPRHEYRIIHKSGEVRWIEIYSSRIEYDGASATQTLFIDITDRKRTEQALRESEERYRSLIQGLQVGVVVHDAETTRIKTINPVAQEILELTEEQIGSRLIEDDWELLREDGKPMPVEEYPVSQVLATREPVRNMIAGGYHTGRGERVWTLVNADPVFDRQGDLQQVIVTFMDITERKRAEHVLWKSEEWCRSISPTSHIRCLGMEDYDDLLALWRRAGLHSLKPSGRDSREAVARQLASGVQTILGLEVAGELVGAVVATHDSRKGWINRLVVDPDYRRRGYGAQLIAAAEDVLREQGMRVIAALVESDNPASLALFRKEGYVEIDSGIHYLSKRDSEEA